MRKMWTRLKGPARPRGAQRACLTVEALERREVLANGFLTLAPSYLTALAPGATVTPLLTTGDAVDGYKMIGIPDGLGAFDNGDGTFTVLMYHELPATAGVVRDHGQMGAFVSMFVIDKSTLEVLSGGDLIQRVVLDGTASTAFARLCSADLPALTAFFNAQTGLGTRERIFMNGEETGNEGRGFGTVVSTGTAYE